MGGWMPGATRMPGRNAGYREGRARHESVVCHYTVGIDSAPVGVRGYFNFLVRRNGEIVQFAESDAVTWHAGDWNDRGPGIEVEYYEQVDGPHPQNIFTPAQLVSCGLLVHWLHDTDGYPLDFYDGPRVRAHHGFITHRSLIQTGAWHHDYWSHDQWNQMVQGHDEEAELAAALDTIGVWMQDTREILLEKLGEWMQDTRKVLMEHIDTRIVEQDTRTRAALEATKVELLEAIRKD